MSDFYLRYTVGHHGKFGHEYLEFEFHQNGKFNYTNSSGYKNDAPIIRTVYLTDTVLQEIQKMILDSQILLQDDVKWPLSDTNGYQEVEIVHLNHHISFNTTKIGTLSDTLKTHDPKGLAKFYFFIQDIKSLALSIVQLHFKTKPI